MAFHIAQRGIHILPHFLHLLDGLLKGGEFFFKLLRLVRVAGGNLVQNLLAGAVFERAGFGRAGSA